MSLSKYIDSLYGELSLRETGEDAGINKEALKTKSLKTRLRIHLARTAVAVYPSGVERLLTNPYTKKGYEVVGYGFQSTVLRIGDEAIKVMRRSMYEDNEWREAKVEDLSSRQDIAQSYIGDFIIPQAFSIEDHPVFTGRETILSRQPYIEFDHYPIDNLFGYDELSAQSRHLYRFGRGALRMLQNEQLVPDILGTNNVVLYDGMPVLLDSVPMSMSDNPTAFDKIGAILEKIAATYAELADQSRS